MKFSRFNAWTVDKDGALIILNFLTGALAVFDDNRLIKVEEALKRNQPRFIPAEFLEVFEEDGFLVEKEYDEVDKINNLVNRRHRWNNEYFLSIVLNLDCNFGCFYCFEKHTGEYLTNDTARRIISMVRIKSTSMKRLSVDWYGGEPLLSFRRLKEMNNLLMEICEKKGVAYDFSITTNGYLLSSEVISYLGRLPLTHLQITLDGPSETHNKSRPLKNGNPTFEMIFSNAKEAVSAGLEVVIRVNITKENIGKIPLLYRFMESEGLKNKVHLMIKPVVSSPANPCVSRCLSEKPLGIKMTEIYKQAAGKEWIVFPNVDTLQCMGFCIAEYPNQFIIDPKGNLYKCGELFNKEQRVGYLDDEGDIRLTNRGEYDRWTEKNPLVFSECKNCVILPICMGGCCMKRFRYGTDCCEELKYDLPGFLEILVLNQKNIEIQKGG